MGGGSVFTPSFTVSVWIGAKSVIFGWIVLGFRSEIGLALRFDFTVYGSRLPGLKALDFGSCTVYTTFVL